MTDDIMKAIQGAKERVDEEFYQKAVLAFDNAGYLLDLAKEEFISRRYENAAKAALMSIKLYAAKKQGSNDRGQRIKRALDDAACYYGEITLNNRSIRPDVMEYLGSSKRGQNVILIQSVSSEAFLILGCCYFSFFPAHFLSYNMPFTLLVNTRRTYETGNLCNPDFTSNREHLRIIDCVGFLLAYLNCSHTEFPVPWSKQDMEVELRQPLNWQIV